MNCYFWLVTKVESFLSVPGPSLTIGVRRQSLSAGGPLSVDDPKRKEAFLDYRVWPPLRAVGNAHAPKILMIHTETACQGSERDKLSCLTVPGFGAFHHPCGALSALLEHLNSQHPCRAPFEGWFRLIGCGLFVPRVQRQIDAVIFT